MDPLDIVPDADPSDEILCFFTQLLLLRSEANYVRQGNDEAISFYLLPAKIKSCFDEKGLDHRRGHCLVDPSLQA